MEDQVSKCGGTAFTACRGIVICALYGGRDCCETSRGGRTTAECDHGVDFGSGETAGS